MENIDGVIMPVVNTISGVVRNLIVNRIVEYLSPTEIPIKREESPPEESPASADGQSAQKFAGPRFKVIQLKQKFGSIFMAFPKEWTHLWIIPLARS